MSFLQEFQKNQKALKDAERLKKKNATTLLNNYHGGEHDIRDHERVINEERKHNNVRCEVDSHGVPVNSAENNNRREDDDCLAGGKSSRQLIEVDFTFGIIYDDSESEPGPTECASAAAVIIPHVISEWTNDTKIVCDSKTPQVIGKIGTDDWYDGDNDGSIRYVVKGSVPVYLFVESSAKEAAEPLQKVLKRRVSFRPISATEVESSTKENRSQFIIGTKGQQWMRVRDGRLGGLGITF